MMEERTNGQQEAFREAADPALPVAQNLAMILRSIFTLNREVPLWSALFMEFTAHASRDKKVRDQLAMMQFRLAPDSLDLEATVEPLSRLLAEWFSALSAVSF